jgi:hypothetical protein
MSCEIATVLIRDMEGSRSPSGAALYEAVRGNLAMLKEPVEINELGDKAIGPEVM